MVKCLFITEFHIILLLVNCLKKGFLSPLVNPQARVETRIDTSGIEKKGDDFDIPQLSERTKEYLVSAAYETSIIASERKK